MFNVISCIQIFFFFWSGPYKETLVPLTWAPLIFSVHASGLGTLFRLDYIYKATEKLYFVLVSIYFRTDPILTGL